MDGVIVPVCLDEALDGKSAIEILVPCRGCPKVSKGGLARVLNDLEPAIALQQPGQQRVVDVLMMRMKRPREQARGDRERMHKNRMNRQTAVQWPDQFARMGAELGVLGFHYHRPKISV